MDGDFAYMASENRDKFMGPWRFNLWRQNVRTYERELLYSVKQVGFSIDDYEVRNGRIVLLLGAAGRDSDGAAFVSSWFSQLEPGKNRLETLLLRREYRSDAKSATRDCGERLISARPTTGGYVTASMVVDVENPPAADCPGPERPRGKSTDSMIFRWLDRDGQPERKVRYRVRYIGGWPAQLFANGRGVFESDYTYWRVEDLRTRKSKTYSATYSIDHDTGVFVGEGKAVAALRRTPGGTKRSRYTLRYFADPLRSGRSAFVAHFRTQDVRAEFCGDRFIYLDQRRTRAFTFDPANGRSELLVDTHGLRQFWFTCDSRGAVFWRSHRDGEDAVRDSARYLRF